jgi:stage V sporulation protein B
MSMAFILPFISISSILRGYFFGKQQMMAHTVSNAIEQVVRLLIIWLILPKFADISPTASICAFILLSIISETVSIIVFLFFLPKGFTIKKSDIKPDLSTTKEIVDLCLPTVSGRIIGNIAYFFEPIILTYILKLVGYSSEFILNEYGVYNAYVIPLLMIPSFIVQSISTALVPEISKSYAKNDIRMVKKRLKQSLALSLFLGIITNTFVFFFPEFLLKLVYNTTSGVAYIKVLAFIFILYNLEGPLSSTLEALGKTKIAFRTTTIGVLIKTVSIVLFSLLHIGLYGLVIGEILDIIFVVFNNYHNIRKILYSK